MPHKFSQELRQRIIRHFQKCFDLTISDDDADLYLDSLAKFYDFFADLPLPPAEFPASGCK
jgi:hypothetical protein